MIHKFMFIFLLLSYSCDIFADGNEDSLKSGEVNVYVYPFAFYTPETEFAFGAGGVINFRSSKDSLNKPSSITLSAYYSTRNQYLISLIPELYFDNGKYLLNVDFNFGKTVDEFYGIGNYTEDIDNSEYKYQAIGVNLSFQRQLFDEYYLGLIYDFGKEKMLDKKDNPYLKSGDITGTDGGLTSGLGFKLTWDSRDNIFYPSKGGYHQVSAVYYQKTFGSDFIFNNYTVDLRRYLSASEDHIFAFQVYTSFVHGNTPFYKLPALGGSSLMRGYYEGRYRDKYYFTTQVEYRTELFKRMGLVGFAGIGEVANSLSGYKLSGLKYSFGIGLRYTIDVLEKLNVRADFGIGKNTTGIYFSIEEAF